MSPRLPGTFDDHLRDGSLISIKSVGNNRFTTDAFFNATYDLYASYGGGKLWNTESYLLPALPTGDRGFIVDPFLEAIFEDPETDQTNAAFVLPLLVIDKNTKEVYLLIQIDRDSLKKGIHKNTTIYLDIFKLKNRLLCK